MIDAQDSTPFHLLIEFARTSEGDDPFAYSFTRQEYLLRMPSGVREVLTIDWQGGLLDDLRALQRGAPSPERVQRLGVRLRGLLDEAGWGALEARILEALDEGRQVQLSLRSSAAELFALPWELIPLEHSGQALAELPGVLLRYEWPGTQTPPPPPPQRDPRLLFAWSDAGGAVPHEAHTAALSEAGRGEWLRFEPARDALPRVRVEALAESLDAHPPTALHLLCHGAASGHQVGLALQDRVLDAGALRRLLAPHAGTLRLVVLNACDSGDTAALGSTLGGLALALHRAGIQAVISSRVAMSAQGSIRLTERLYRDLLTRRRPLEDAFLEARRELANRPGLDWAALQLHSRAADGLRTSPPRPHGLPVTARVQLGDQTLRLRQVPAGRHHLAQPLAEPDAPRRADRALEGFLIADTVVTAGQWRSLMGQGEATPQGQRPMDQVSWLDAVRFCNRLSERDGRAPAYSVDGSSVTQLPDASGYRLPSYAEWEAAALAGSPGPWCFGDGFGELEEYAWFGEPITATPHPVAQKRPNAWGLYDMHGNQREWVEESSGALSAALTGPRAQRRIARGGDVWADARACRAESWSDHDADTRAQGLGFRVAASVPRDAERAERADRAREASELYARASRCIAEGDSAQARELLLEVVRLLDTLEGSPEASRANAKLRLGILEAEAGRLDEARRWYLQALEHQRTIGDLEEQCDTLHNLGALHAEHGHVAEAIRWYEQAVELLNSLGKAEGEADTCHNLGVLLHEARDYSEAMRWYRRALALRERLPGWEGVAWTRHNMGLLERLVGHFEEAAAHFQAALELRERGQDSEGVIASGFQLAKLCVQLGRHDQARALLARVEALQEAAGDHGGVLRCHHLLALMRARELDAEGERLEAMRHWFAAARLAADFNDPQRATLHAEQALAHAQALGDPAWTAPILQDLVRFAELRGDLREVERWLEELRALAQAHGLPAREADASFALARAALGRGEVDRVESLTRRAIVLYKELESGDGVARAYSIMAALEWTRGRHQRSIRWRIRCASAFQELGDEAQLQRQVGNYTKLVEQAPAHLRDEAIAAWNAEGLPELGLNP